MATTTIRTTEDGINRARTLGGHAADAYSGEFGVSPADDGAEAVGDWDASAWGTHWRELVDDAADENVLDYDLCLAAWRAGFWGEEAARADA